MKRAGDVEEMTRRTIEADNVRLRDRLAQVEAQRDALIRSVREKPVVPIAHLSPGDPIHHWFELSYAQFLTIPRVFMEAMPLPWQQRMAALLLQLDEEFNWCPTDGRRWWVSLRDAHGRFMPPDHCDYRHGNVEHLRTLPPSPFESPKSALPTRWGRWLRRKLMGGG